MNRRRFFLGTAAAALAPFALSISSKAEKLPQDGVEWFTNVPVVTQDGHTLRFYDDVMKGKILLINFFFTSCDDVCPLATEIELFTLRSEIVGVRLPTEVGVTLLVSCSISMMTLPLALMRGTTRRMTPVLR